MQADRRRRIPQPATALYTPQGPEAHAGAPQARHRRHRRCQLVRIRPELGGSGGSALAAERRRDKLQHVRLCRRWRQGWVRSIFEPNRRRLARVRKGRRAPDPTGHLLRGPWIWKGGQGHPSLGVPSPCCILQKTQVVRPGALDDRHATTHTTKIPASTIRQNQRTRTALTDYHAPVSNWSVIQITENLKPITGLGTRGVHVGRPRAARPRALDPRTRQASRHAARRSTPRAHGSTTPRWPTSATSVLTRTRPPHMTA